MPAVSAVSRRNRTALTSTLVRPLPHCDETDARRRSWIFLKSYRMTPALFDVLLSFVALDLTKIHVSRETLQPGERLAITLSYLASGQDIPSVALAYQVGIETARLCIHERCEAIWGRLKDYVMKTPTKADWQCIAEGFNSRWQFRNCLGAIDGKHVAIAQPSKTLCRKCLRITAARWGDTDSHHQPAPQPCGLRGEGHNFFTLYNPHVHQFLDREDSFGNVVGGRWRHDVQHVPDNSFFAMATTQAQNYDGDAGAARRLFASYFSSTAGQVPWQWCLPGLTMKQPS
ncbi:hypothetical protein MRX96_010179 [Rhipicephalus microplus]